LSSGLLDDPAPKETVVPVLSVTVPLPTDAPMLKLLSSTLIDVAAAGTVRVVPASMTPVAPVASIVSVWPACVATAMAALNCA
jgi:hypothetical protein